MHVPGLLCQRECDTKARGNWHPLRSALQCPKRHVPQATVGRYSSNLYRKLKGKVYLILPRVEEMQSDMHRRRSRKNRVHEAHADGGESAPLAPTSQPAYHIAGAQHQFYKASKCKTLSTRTTGNPMNLWRPEQHHPGSSDEPTTASKQHESTRTCSRGMTNDMDRQNLMR